MNILKKAAAGIIAATMLLSVAGCSKGNYALKLGDVTVSPGVYVYLQTAALNEAQSSEDYDAELKNIWDNKIDGLSLKDYINDKALENTKQYAVVEDWFNEKGLTLSEDDLANADAYADYYWEYYSEYYEALGISEDSFKNVMINNYKYQDLFMDYYSPDGENAIPEDELRQYYTENYAQYKAISISKIDPETSTAYDDDTLTVLEQKANDYLSRLQSGEDIDELIYEYALENAKEGEEVTLAEGDENLQNVELSAESKLSNAVFDAEAGTPTLASDDNYYYVFIRYDVSENEEYYDSLLETLMYNCRSEEFEDLLAEKTANAKFDINTGELKKYKPKKLVDEQ